MVSTNGLDLAALAAAGWSAADATWEFEQESAAQLAAAERIVDAHRPWAHALRLAREGFAGDDPRLATSLANHAFALRRKGETDIAGRLFAQALRVWDASPRWIDDLVIESNARSSLFHLRMEVRHRAAYKKTARLRLHRFAAEGRAAVLALSNGDKPKTSRFSRWKAEKPSLYTDSRKLLSAALLVAPG